MERTEEMIVDQHGRRVTRSVKRESEGWGVTCWWGGGYPGSIATNIERRVYRTRDQARVADISELGAGLMSRVVR